MRQIVLSLADQAVVVQYPESLQDDLRTLLGGCTNRAPKAAPTILVQEDGSSDRYILHPDGRDKLRGLDKGSCIYALLGEVGHSLLTNLSAGVAFHAGAVSLRNLGIVLPGTSGSGRVRSRPGSSTTASIILPMRSSFLVLMFLTLRPSHDRLSSRAARAWQSPLAPNDGFSTINRCGLQQNHLADSEASPADATSMSSDCLSAVCRRCRVDNRTSNRSTDGTGADGLQRQCSEPRQSRI